MSNYQSLIINFLENDLEYINDKLLELKNEIEEAFYNGMRAEEFKVNGFPKIGAILDYQPGNITFGEAMK